MKPQPCFFEKNQGLFAFLFAAIIFFVLQQIWNITYFPFDASGYWKLSDPSIFFDYPKEIRGYFYPLLLLPPHLLSTIFHDSNLYPYRICSSLVYGHTLTNLLPSFYQQIFGGTLSLKRRLIVPAFIATLFPGIVLYPLSDLPAFLLLIGAIYLLMKTRGNVSAKKTALLLIASGVLAGGAYNTRTIYLFPMLCIFAAIPTYILSARKPRIRLFGALAFTVGLTLVSIPQVFINHRTHDTWSPAVISQRTDKSLFALQLMWGITIQRYETVVDPAAASPTRYFMDRAGEQLFATEKLENAEVSIRTYASLVAKHPLDFIGIYGRHMVNGLDLRDGEVYIKNGKSVNDWIAAINFIIISIALLVALVRYARRHDCTQYGAERKSLIRQPAQASWPAWLFILLLPVIGIIPGAIETRFFLPLQMLLYATIAFNSSISELKTYVQKNWLVAACGFVLIYALFFAISTNAMSSMQFTIHPPYRFGQ